MKKSVFIAMLLCALSAVAQDEKQLVLNQLDKKYENYCQIARTIWSHPELGYLESKSTKVLQDELRKEGFSVQAGVAEMPTAFVASYGSGQPVIGILAEFDALPGLSQDSVPYPKPIVVGGNGHGCGHNLFGTGSLAAAVALKDWFIKTGKKGTVRLYGTPAEEGGGGKVYFVRAGLFNDVDAVIHWHPGDSNNADASTCLAVSQANFRFYGQTAHAAAAPERGRSALDGVEAMNYMVNMMREHVDEKARIHYVITKGGLAANVVPDYAEVEYMFRHPDVRGVQEIFDRIVKAAEGAALGTGTTMKYEIMNGLYNILPNETLAKVMHANLMRVGGVKYNAQELAFANKMRESFTTKVPPITNASDVQPYRRGYFPASSDVGDVSWIVPTVGMNPATWIPGTAAHTWQATAADGMSIGFKGMLVAAKSMAMTAIDLVNDPSIISRAKSELEAVRGADFKYKPLIGDRKPPLDYRKNL